VNRTDGCSYHGRSQSRRQVIYIVWLAKRPRGCTKPHASSGKQRAVHACGIHTSALSISVRIQSFEFSVCVSIPVCSKGLVSICFTKGSCRPETPLLVFQSLKACLPRQRPKHLLEPRIYHVDPDRHSSDPGHIAPTYK
jgi:hypothetical protein